MTIEKISLLPELKNLEELRIEELNRNGELYYNHSYHIALKNITFANFKNPCESLAKPLTEHWMRFFKGTLLETSIPGVYLDEIDYFIDLITRNKLVKDLSAEPRKITVLAHVCITRAFLNQRGNRYFQTNNISDLLEQWTGHQISTEIIESQEQMVSFLYGNSVWQLLCDDMPHPEDIAEMLINQKLPILGVQVDEQAENTSNVEELPYDF